MKYKLRKIGNIKRNKQVSFYLKLEKAFKYEYYCFNKLISEGNK